VALRAEIRSIQRSLGTTTVYVTHDQEEALSLSDRVVVMNQARIEQLGTPFEIYNFPSTRFVASFVGTLNALIAEVVDPQTGLLSVQGQRVFAVAPIADVTAGEIVSVTIRPEQLHLGSDVGLENTLAGQIENIAFLGSIVRLFIRVGDSLVLLDEFNNPHLSLPSVGAQVTISFGREACRVLESAVPPAGIEALSATPAV